MASLRGLRGRGLSPQLLMPPAVFQLLLCLLAFVVPSLQALLISLFPRRGLEIRYVFFLLVYVIPRFLSPGVYGFRDQLFRTYWARYLGCWGPPRTRPGPKGNP